MRRRVLKWLRTRVGGVPTPRHGAAPPIFMRVAYRVPRQVVLVTACHEGRSNVWPMDWHGPLSSEPRLYGIAVNSGSYGAELVRASGAYVVHFVPASWEEAIFFCGRTSGRGVDKFEAAGLRTERARTVDVPRIIGALGVLECAVAQEVSVGDHTLFVGHVLHAESHNDAPRLHHLDSALAHLAEQFE